MYISIIGDSSSSSIGDDKFTYPKVLYNKILSEEKCEIKNYSVPGITSSDAKALYFNKISKDKNDILIIYLGNNESAYGNYKGYKSHFNWSINKFFLAKKQYNKKFFLRDKFRFSYKFSNSNISNSNSDFKNNLESILKNAIKKNTFVILINPIANKFFPSGSGATNFEFFKLINFNDKVSSILKGTDEYSNQLIKGIAHQENREYDKSIEIYNSIIKNNDGILNLIAQNNSAAIYFEKDRYRSKNILTNLLNKYEEYDPIIYYNLYLLEKNFNKIESEKYLNNSYLKDFSLYRIQKEYRNVISELRNKYRVSYLDLLDVLKQEDFIDYCHPSSKGHINIADKVFEIIKRKDKFFTDCSGNNFTQELVSPDYFYGPTQNYLDYNFIEKKISKKTITKNLSYLLNKYNFNDFLSPKLFDKYSKNEDLCCIINFIKSNINHPIFTQSLISQELYGPYQNEIFSLPENYIHRIIFYYIIFFEKNILGKSTKMKEFKFSSNFYNKIILSNIKYPKNLPLFIKKDYQDEIEKKIYFSLKNNKEIFKNNIFERTKTIMSWYTRESFRYGTLSRKSMLYERFKIDKLMESLIVLITIDFKINGKKIKVYEKIYNLLNSLINIHENQIDNFLSHHEFNDSIYNKQLKEIEKDFNLILESKGV